MDLTRRQWSAGIASAGLLGLSGSRAAVAQGAPVEGVHYLRLPEPVPTVAGKIEAIEFFWYECPHCNAFEPALDAWSKRLPDDVAFRRVPVWFREEPFAVQQRLFYTLDSLGLLPTLHARVFRAIHGERERLRTPEDIAAFALKNGVEPIRFMTAYASPAVQAKAVQARHTAESYRVDAVPAIGVAGRYLTSGSLANNGSAPGSNERMLAVADALIARTRQAQRS